MDPYLAIAAVYDVEHDDYTDDVAFYRQFIRAGPVLEIGVGTGRIMQPLLEDGWEVWGVDPSETMLDRARRRIADHPAGHLVRQSVQALDLPRQFETVIVPLNTLGHIQTIDAQLAGMLAIRRHIAPTGVLVVDQSNPHSMADRGAAGEVRRRFLRRLGSTSVSGWSAVWDDEAEQTLTVHLWYDHSGEQGAITRTETDLRLRYSYRFELELLLRQAHFRVAEIYGSYDLEPYGVASPRLIFTAQAAQGP